MIGDSEIKMEDNKTKDTLNPSFCDEEISPEEYSSHMDIQKRQESNKDIIIDVESKALRTHENKEKWLGQIMLKQIQGKPLSDDDWDFYMHSFMDGSDKDIEDMAKGMVIELHKIAVDNKETIDPETYWALRQRDLGLVQNMLKVVKQGRKDDSVVRKNDLSSFNKYVKEAKKRGGAVGSEYFGVEKVKIVEASDCVDKTKKVRGKKKDDANSTI